MEASYIKPAFPGGAFSQPTPPVGPRAELLIFRTTGNYYNWAVPYGVTFIKATVISGTGTTSLGQYATSTTGAFTVGTARFPQNIGPSFSSATITTYAGIQGVVFLQNMDPGTNIRITIGTGGAVLLEY
jgi:hypothetical protein